MTSENLNHSYYVAHHFDRRITGTLVLLFRIRRIITGRWRRDKRATDNDLMSED
ncbi:hypothetical protein RHMOL_Rhmol12G0235500 [Rhododendron molle]|uniref:Uncharacterized protein n=1 Tax=Rhododendron molle TaxID=49168 RepID=A0ACC0LMG7_RHOML|nr:hypothetical protein RHMOL_Rhmol12G0235500 [Rhododendron molle]